MNNSSKGSSKSHPTYYTHWGQIFSEVRFEIYHFKRCLFEILINPKLYSYKAMKGVCINQNDKRARVHIDQDVIDSLQYSCTSESRQKSLSVLTYSKGLILSEYCIAEKRS